METVAAWDAIALPGAAAVGLLAAAWWSGWVAGLLCTPLALGLGAVAYASLEGGSRGTARHLVALGAIAFFAALWVAVAGGGVLPWLAAALGLACAQAGVRHSLRCRPVAAETGYSPRAPGLQMSMAADLGLGALWELVAATSWRQLERVSSDLEHAVDRYEERGWIADPEAAFPPPPPLTRLTVTGCRVVGEAVDQLRFESEFEPFDEEIAQRHLERIANRQANVLMWRHPGEEGRPVVISLHGFGMGYASIDIPWLRRRGWDLPAMYHELGFDVAYFNLPLHGPRNARPWSGRGFLDDHPLETTAAMAQAVWDLRRFIGWLRTQGAPAVALHGISLGGTVAALCASLEDGIAAVLPMAPAVDLAQAAWDQLPFWRRERAVRAGLSQQQLARAWSLHSPLSHQVRVARPGRLLVAGFADRISPPHQIERLWRHWEEPAIYWYPGAHLFTRARNAIQLRFATHLLQQMRPAGSTDTPPLSRFRPGGGGGDA